jgi:predicted dehydrogenase
MPGPVEAILIGAGSRGRDTYGAYALAHPGQLRFVAVAEPQPIRRGRFAEAHGIPPARQFETWQDLVGTGQLARATVIATQDATHVAPTVAALRAGYDVLLEKPMADTLAGCVHLVRVAEETGRLLQISHGLRYTPFFSTVHDLIARDRLGQVIAVEHRENVSYWHMAHSYVRGNWRNRASAGPMILTKCCHDLDLLYWFLGPCERISSTGALVHYRPENAPPGAPARCTDGCPQADACPWYAPRLYMDLVPLLQVARGSQNLVERLGATMALDYPTLTRLLRRLAPAADAMLDYRGWPISVLSEDTSPAARWQALEEGPYGRCVYRCDNDVVDQQVVTMAFPRGVSAVLVMHGHSHEEGRTLRIDGSRATLRGRYTPNRQEIELHDHHTGRVQRIRIRQPVRDATGHGGGDAGLIDAFVTAVQGHSPPPTTARASLESHLMAFAADEARLKRSVIDVEAYRQQAEAAAARQDKGKTE